MQVTEYSFIEVHFHEVSGAITGYDYNNQNGQEKKQFIDYPLGPSMLPSVFK